MPKICAGNLDYCRICLRINLFATKAYIFSAQILGGSELLLADGAGFFNEAIWLPH
jgi:hypothetical protein